MEKPSVFTRLDWWRWRIIAKPVVALELEATLDDMAAIIHARPTVWEALGNSFDAVRGFAINFQLEARRDLYSHECRWPIGTSNAPNAFTTWSVISEALEMATLNCELRECENACYSVRH